MGKDYARQRRHELEARLNAQGLALDSYLEAVNYTQERMEEEFEKEAGQLIRNELVLDAVIAAEKMDVSDEDLQEEIEKRAEMFSINPESFRAALEERGALDELGEDLLRRKALKFLGDNAVFAGVGGEPAPAQEADKSSTQDSEGEPAEGEPADRGEEPAE